MKLLIDAHLDLAWNALSFNRDQTWSIAEIRAAESHMTDLKAHRRATVSLPELRRAGVAVCVATLLARGGPDQPAKETYPRTDLDHRTQSIAHAAAHGQLAYYRLLETQGHARILTTSTELDRHWQQWRTADAATRMELPVGLIISMEGADPIVGPEQTHKWFAAGLRAIGPAHYGPSHYAGGTGCNTPLTDAGRRLLSEMQGLGMMLDVTHLCDPSMAEAFELYDGPVLASHHNCRSLVDHERQLTDDQIKKLIERDAVIGTALDAWMLYRPGWKRGETQPDVLNLESVAEHIDHVCQIAGNTRHSAIGSDLDGGFGTEQTPGDLETIADLQKIVDILARRGYTDEDIDAIFHNNWLRFFRRALPK